MHGPCRKSVGHRQKVSVDTAHTSILQVSSQISCLSQASLAPLCAGTLSNGDCRRPHCWPSPHSVPQCHDISHRHRGQYLGPSRRHELSEATNGFEQISSHIPLVDRPIKAHSVRAVDYLPACVTDLMHWFIFVHDKCTMEKTKMHIGPSHMHTSVAQR